MPVEPDTWYNDVDLLITILTNACSKFIRSLQIFLF